jgi:hypothetical protein
MSPVKVLSALPVVVVVSKVKLLFAPVTAPIIMSPVVSVALVSMVVAVVNVIAPKVMSSLVLSIEPARVDEAVLTVSPPSKVKLSPDASPMVKVPSLPKVTALVTDDPLPVSETLATVLPIVNVVTSTSAENDAVPPTSISVNVVTPLIAPDAVISLFGTLLPVDSVNVFEPPVTAPMVMSPVVLVALVSMVTLEPSVTAPKTIASLLLVMDEAFRVTVPLVFSVNPPLKAKLSDEASPMFSVPSFAKLVAPLKVLEAPLRLILATVLSALNAAAAILALKVTVPPTSANVKLPKPVISTLESTSAPSILLPVESVRLLEPPVGRL